MFLALPPHLSSLKKAMRFTLPRGRITFTPPNNSIPPPALVSECGRRDKFIISSRVYYQFTLLTLYLSLLTEETIIAPPRAGFELRLGELYTYRELLFSFVMRDVRVKYRHAFFGIAWAILQPLGMTVLQSLFFRRGLHLAAAVPAYTLVSFMGWWLWGIFSGGVLGAARSMVDNAEMIKKIYFPRMIIPAAAVLAAVLDAAAAALVLLILLVWYAPLLDVARVLLLLPLAVIQTVVATFGLGAFFAAMNVRYRDFQYALPFLIQLGLFLSPVVYPAAISIGSGSSVWAYVLALHPLSGAIVLAQSIVSPTANVSFPLAFISLSAVSALGWLVVGVVVFRRAEAHFADLA